MRETTETIAGRTSFSPKLVHRLCPLCGRDDAELHLSAGDTTFGFPGAFNVVRCRSCNMLYTSPQVAPEDIAAFYPADYSAHDANRATAHAEGARGDDPWDALPEIGRKRLLDLGCGSGAYLLRQQRRGWQVFGVEPSANAAAAARRHGLEVITGVIPGVDISGRQFEIITVLGVLDHVPGPLETLRSLRDAIAPQGQLIVTVPNATSAAAACFGADWPGWDLPRHQNHFTPSTLVETLRRSGFQYVRLSWKRRTSRWRRGAALRVAATETIGWRLLASSRDLCGLIARIRSRGDRSDEIVAVASVAPRS